MKLRNKLAAITAATMLAFTGVGFAAWTFQKEVEVSKTPDNIVTCAIEADNVKFYNGSNELENLYLVFDAPTDGITDKVSAGDGIFFSTEQDGSAKIDELTVKAELKHLENNQHYEDTGACLGIFEDNKELTDTKAYLSMTGGAFSDNNINITNADNDVEVTYTLPTLTYTNAFKNAVTDADHLASLFSGISLELNVSFHLE